LLDGGTNRDVWRDFDLDMDVVVVGINGNNLELGIFFHRVSKDGQKFRFDILFQKLPAIFSSPDNMVLMLVG